MAEIRINMSLSINGMSKSFGRNKNRISINLKCQTWEQSWTYMGENGAGKIDNDEMSLRNLSKGRRNNNIRWRT